MKTINQYIKTKSYNEINIFKGLKGALLSEKIINVLIKYNTACRINLGNKAAVKKLWERVLAVCGYEDFVSFGIRNENAFRNVLLANADRIIDNWPAAAISKIKNFDLSETEKKYRVWKSSDAYVKGEEFKADAEYTDDDDLQRIMVVYDANNPGDTSTVRTYKFSGKIGKHTQETINMFKVDWKYDTGLKYFDARPCLLSHYLNKSEEELMKLYDDDIIGLND